IPFSPATKTKPPARIPWLYGPIGAPALSVRMTSFDTLMILRRLTVANRVKRAAASRTADSDERAGRFDPGEIRGIGIVDRGVIVHIVQIERHVQHVLEVGASGFENRLEVFEGVARGGARISFRGYAEGRMTGAHRCGVDEIVRADGLAVWSGRGICLRCSHRSVVPR